MVVTVYSNDDSINWSATGTERIIQNVRNILRTRQFEVPFIRELGIDGNYIDITHSDISAEFTAHVEDIINEFEPRVTVRDVKLESFDENGNYNIAVELEV